MTTFIHPTADVADDATIGSNTRIWHQAQIRNGVVIGEECIIGKGVFLDSGVIIGNRVKIQNYVSVYHGVTIEDGVFVGPHVCFTNDLTPRAINLDGSLKDADDWVISSTLVCNGASLGANTTIVCGVRIGAWAMVGAGSVVTRDVPDYALVMGNPARLRGFVCACGHQVRYSSPETETAQQTISLTCPHCQNTITIPVNIFVLADRREK